MIKSSSYIYKKSKIRNAKPDWKVPEGGYIYRNQKSVTLNPIGKVPEERYIYRKSKIREVKPHRGDIYLHYPSNVIFFLADFADSADLLKKILLNILSR